MSQPIHLRRRYRSKSQPAYDYLQTNRLLQTFQPVREGRRYRLTAYHLYKPANHHLK